MCFDSTINSLYKHSIQCIACFNLRINSVNKQDTILIHNSIALTFCMDCLNMPFNVHSNYNVDSNMKTSNYMKIRFKALIYFELQETMK